MLGVEDSVTGVVGNHHGASGTKGGDDVPGSR